MSRRVQPVKTRALPVLFLMTTNSLLTWALVPVSVPSGHSARSRSALILVPWSDLRTGDTPLVLSGLGSIALALSSRVISGPPRAFKPCTPIQVSPGPAWHERCYSEWVAVVIDAHAPGAPIHRVVNLEVPVDRGLISVSDHIDDFRPRCATLAESAQVVRQSAPGWRETRRWVGPRQVRPGLP